MHNIILVPKFLLKKSVYSQKSSSGNMEVWFHFISSLLYFIGRYLFKGWRIARKKKRRSSRSVMLSDRRDGNPRAQGTWNREKNRPTRGTLVTERCPRPVRAGAAAAGAEEETAARAPLARTNGKIVRESRTTSIRVAVTDGIRVNERRNGNASGLGHERSARLLEKRKGRKH